MNSCKLAHTDRFLVFDKAATVIDSSMELDEEGNQRTNGDYVVFIKLSNSNALLGLSLFG